MGRRYYTLRSGMLAPPFRETRCMVDPYRPLRKPLHDTVSTRGLRQHVTRWTGEDPEPLMLLHGWMDTGDTFQFLVDAMPTRHTFVAPDWRGFGRSEWPADGYWFPDYYGDLDALLDRFSPDAPVTLIGHSMGGNIATLYAGIRPERVRRAGIASTRNWNVSPVSIQPCSRMSGSGSSPGQRVTCWRRPRVMTVSCSGTRSGR